MRVVHAADPALGVLLRMIERQGAQFNGPSIVIAREANDFDVSYARKCLELAGKDLPLPQIILNKCPNEGRFHVYTIVSGGAFILGLAAVRKAGDKSVSEDSLLLNKPIHVVFLSGVSEDEIEDIKTVYGC